MKIGIITNHNVTNTKNVLLKLTKELEKKSLEYAIENIDNLKNNYDFICVIGGDGTILKAARYYANYDIPIIGINLGRLGFLSQIGTNDIEQLVDRIKNNSYEVQERIMLTSGKYTALNDFVIKGSSSNRTSQFSLKINDKFVCDYVADGIIISTPTGSTAYGLSAGGPILSPEIDCIVIVPICPHTLTARPLVIPSDEKITVSSIDEPLTFAIDGQEKGEIISECNINVATKKAKLAFIWDDDFYTILRNKLHWGISPNDIIIKK